MTIRRIVAAAIATIALAAAPASHAQDAGRGESLYRTYCTVCHTIPPSGGPDRAPNDPARIRAAASGGVPQMVVVSFLSDAQLADIAAWIAQALGIPAPAAANYTGLWYNFPAESESGWGVNFTHQGDIVFATLFTYDSSGAPLWLVMPAGQRQAGTSTFSGALYRTRGPAFNASPFVWDPNAPGNLTSVGSMTVTFAESDRATLGYTVNGAAVTKTIMKQVYGSRAANCSGMAGSRASLANYQDLWYNAPAESEPGWGVNLTHQDNTLFATLFTYDSTGRDLWLVMSDGRRQSDGSYLGTLFQTTGPAFNANPFTPIGPGNVSTVGTMRLSFSNGESGTLTYTYNGVTVTKSITRQVFSATVFRCD